MYKANPVPTFYREGPPPKVELKKVTKNLPFPTEVLYAA